MLARRLRSLLIPLTLLALALGYAVAPALSRTTAVAPAPVSRPDRNEPLGPAVNDFRPSTLPAAVSRRLAEARSAVQQPAVQQSPTDACVDATLVYDEVGGTAGLALGNVQVQLWDKDATSPDDLLAATLTPAAGTFTLCSSASDTDDSANDGLDLVARVVAENGFWRVEDAGSLAAYQFDLATVPNVAPGTTYHYGLSKPGAGTPERDALAIFLAVDRLWSWTSAMDSRTCWDAGDDVPASNLAACRQVVVDWRPDATTRTFYDSGANRVRLNGVDFRWRDAVVREAAKSILDDLVEDDYPDTNDCGNRTSIGTATTAGCAWVEGFADWAAVQVFNDPVLDWQVGAQVFHVDLETPGWDASGWDDGDAVEGRIAGALLDISDSTNEGPWDRLNEGAVSVWSTLLHATWNAPYPYRRHRTFAEFWANRTADGLPVGDGPLATLYQNSIDYGLRDPLTNTVAVQRPTPVPAHNFRLTTTTHFWSVIAVRPPQAMPPVTDYDLELYPTEPMTGSPLAASTIAANTVDLIVIDSNQGKVPLGTFYPRVKQFGGSGPYDLKYVQGSTTIGIGQSLNASMTAANPVASWDSQVAANAQVKLQVTQAAGQNAELLLFCSTPAASTWIRPRSLATAAAAQTVGTETLTWTAPATAPGYCGVVLVNRAGSGTYTVTRVS